VRDECATAQISPATLGSIDTSLFLVTQRQFTAPFIPSLTCGTVTSSVVVLNVPPTDTEEPQIEISSTLANTLIVFGDVPVEHTGLRQIQIRSCIAITDAGIPDTVCVDSAVIDINIVDPCPLATITSLTIPSTLDVTQGETGFLNLIGLNLYPWDHSVQTDSQTTLTN